MSTEKIGTTIDTTVDDENGEVLGEIRGRRADGPAVTTREGIDALSIEHERAGHEFGEAELLWRGVDCGKLGDIGDIPDQCPACGADRMALYYWTVD
ncbi:MAG: hypothetical protein V5A38_07235 [Halolamina sp.]|uniref:DUF7130 family rubredoxin-like protein n=1 Tax=Halolamina sp. TaxID=1940283 RepID=UPI002FC276DC